MKNFYSKNDLIFLYQKYKFPNNLILKDVLIHKELIFNTESQTPENNSTNTTKIKLENSFIIEEEIENKKGTFKKGRNITSKPEQNTNKSMSPNYQFNTWRKNELNEKPGFFYNFKGKTEEKQNSAFKRNLDLSTTMENSFSVNNAFFKNHLEIKGNENNFKFIPNLNYSKEITSTADELYNDPDIIFNMSINDENLENNYSKEGNTDRIIKPLRGSKLFKILFLFFDKIILFYFKR